MPLKTYEVQVRESNTGSGQYGKVRKRVRVKAHNKGEAREAVAKHLGISKGDTTATKKQRSK